MSRSKKNEEGILVIIDTREQWPLNLEGMGIPTIRETLYHGDYSLARPNLRKVLAVERKSIDDFTACCGRERSRFEKELLALRGYRYKMVLCEFTYDDLLFGRYRSQIHPNSVIASVNRWMADGIPFLFTGCRDNSQRALASFLQLVAKEVVGYAKVTINY